MSTIALKCQCGDVLGSASDVSPSSGTRVVCCCSDCQAFAAHLGRDGDTLDEFGGTEIFQISQAQLSIEKGQDKLQCLRLTEKGLLRWYTTCCNTPVGNTLNAKVPFVGVIHSFIDEPEPDNVLGPIRAVVQTQDARGTPGYSKHSAKFPLGITLRIIRKIIVWKLQGKQRPSVFFDNNGQAVVEPIIASHKNA
ncbi:MAG: DUF6151 family protein [Granulosicoccus sp.]